VFVPVTLKLFSGAVTPKWHAQSVVPVIRKTFSGTVTAFRQSYMAQVTPFWHANV